MSTAISDFKCDLGRYLASGDEDDFERVAIDLWRSGVRGKLTIAAKSFRTHGIWALADYRFGRLVRERGIRPLLPVSVIWHVAVESLTGISISYGATIGRGFYIGHLSGIVIGSGVVIGRWCNISQGSPSVPRQDVVRQAAPA